MNRNIASTLILSVSIWLAPVSNAGVLLFDIDSDPSAWATAVVGLTSSTAYNFDLDDDYDVTGFDGPLTSAGGGPVSAGTVADGVLIDRIDNTGGDPGLVGVGPDSGFGNPSNAVIANFFDDAFNISFSSGVTAFAFNALTLSGGSSVDITVFDTLGGSTVFADVDVGGAGGRNWGILGTDGMMFDSLNLFDVATGGEGLQGLGSIYQGEAAAVPVPATLALFALGLAALGWARRK